VRCCSRSVRLAQAANRSEKPRAYASFQRSLDPGASSPSRWTTAWTRWLRIGLASDQDLDTLLKLTDSYCVVYRTLAHGPALSSSSRLVAA
jgi:hypothetical protein